MRPLMTILLCTTMILFVAGCSDDDPVGPPAPKRLAEHEFVLGGGGSTVTNSITASVRVGPNGAVDQVLLSTLLTAADQGKTITVNAASNPDFADAVAVITNGVDDRVQQMVQLTGGGSSSVETTESSYFQGGLSGTFNPDFEGATVTQVQLIVDSLTIESPGSNPNGNGNWTDWYLKARAIVMGRP